MDKMIVGYSILRNSGFGKFIMEKRTVTLNCEMILKDYEYYQKSIISEISSNESVKPTQVRVTGILRLFPIHNSNNALERA